MNEELQLRIIKIIDSIHLLKASLLPSYNLTIEFLTIFSQTEYEFNDLIKQLELIGNKSEANNGYKFNLANPINHKKENINLIRVRKPDIHRPEMGCVDLKYKNEDYLRLREIALERGWDIILRKGYEMIELSSFDIPVLAYLVRDLL